MFKRVLLPRRSPGSALPATLLLALTLALPAHAGGKPAAVGASTSQSAAGGAPAAGAASTASAPAPGALPAWNAPEQYSVDMVCTHEGRTITMKRAISGKRIRTDLEMDGHTMSMIEMGDEDGTTLTLMHEEKQAIQMSEKSALHAAKQADAKVGEPAQTAPTADARIELVGQETVDGRACDKYKCDYNGQVGFAWIDPATKFPVRMESAGAVMEWKNYQVAPQPAKLFEVPKGYSVMNMDDMMKSMGDMKSLGAAMPGGVPGGMPVGVGVPGASGMPGMSGAGSLANRLAGNFGQQMGSQFGTSLGSSLGGAFGGPLGAMAGGYLGGKVGGMLGRKTAEAVTPGK